MNPRITNKENPWPRDLETISKWEKAQIEERKAHRYSGIDGYEHYKDSYRQYFNFTARSFFLDNASVIEIGPADYPGLAYCVAKGKCYEIEPMPSYNLADFCKSEDIDLIKEPAESWQFQNVDEVWLFNVLQHTISPDVIVRKAKEAARIVRFFEPINMPTDRMHLHTFSLNTFYAWFGECVRHYPTNPDAINFHQHECAYGAWVKANQDARIQK